jgi:hypothetical protein
MERLACPPASVLVRVIASDPNVEWSTRPVWELEIRGLLIWQA